MASISMPKLDLSEIIIILRTEGAHGLVISEKVFKDSKILKSWNRIMFLLEKKVVPVLAKGGDISEIRTVLPELVRESKVLGDAFSGAASMIPGPVGIVFSLVRAVACFYGGNIPMGLLELLGCIPGAKLGVKGGSMVCTKVGGRMLAAIRKNNGFAAYYAQMEKLVPSMKGVNFIVLGEQLQKLRRGAAETCLKMDKAPGKFGTLLLDARLHVR